MAITPISSRIAVEHIGGPWDGVVERREVGSTQTSVVLVQQVGPESDEDRLPFLLHDYALVLREGRSRMLYRGARASRTR